ncbi:hypothetical protein [Cryobacterium sp. TMT1-66-1]|uniref:hypothetical protein n=1 Tax=Cryobacterium sp. TMT1-66-1 TaxID=1259242 RepID=UPI0010692E68|nr:hypothetical protein [Cryobacterium sp. TMT1-66-1]TFD03466.1 hypothetical protein E3T29_16625 [Cryobacterium sp. TMT1-66-1]
MRIPSRRRPLHTAVLSALLLSVSVVFLSGCMAAPVPPVPATPVAVASPEPTETPPVFASNEEALAAATAAFAAYLAASNRFLVVTHGDVDSATFGNLVSQRYLPEVLDSMDSFSHSGQSGRGTITFDTASLISYSEPRPRIAEVGVYLCSDISGMRLFDDAGADVTTSSRNERTPTQVAFISSETDASKLLVDREDTWTGQNFCG